MYLRFHPGGRVRRVYGKCKRIGGKRVGIGGQRYMNRVGLWIKVIAVIAAIGAIVAADTINV